MTEISLLVLDFRYVHRMYATAGKKHKNYQPMTKEYKPQV